MDSKILQSWRRIQQRLFPENKAELGPQTPKHAQIMVTLDFLDLERFIPSSSGKGRPPRDRTALACAFVAKAVLNLPTTEALIDRLQVDRVLRRLCGFELIKKLPCKATFSNAFAEFADSYLPQKIHEAIVKNTFSEKLGGKLVGHLSRDSTDIPARGKVPKLKKEDKGKRRNRARGKHRRVVRQLTMNITEMLDDLPKKFDCGSKRGHTWKGYKLHLDVSDGGIPISAIVTAASVHDSQVAIPLEALSSGRITSLYSLMDSAYDAPEIRKFIVENNKIPIIEPHNRLGQTIILDPAERQRYGERTSVERTYSRLKDEFNARQIRVQGWPKVSAHLMFGVLALTVDQLIRIFG